MLKLCIQLQYMDSNIKNALFYIIHVYENFFLHFQNN